MPTASRNPVTEAFFRLHPWIYRKTNGRVLGSFGDGPVLLLNTRGRKSGVQRTNGLIYLDRGTSWAVAASWAGEPKHPLWYLNLKAEPNVTIQIGDRIIPVRARELEGQERNQVWQQIVDQDPGFAEYEKRTEGVREIPVVVFEPRATNGIDAKDGLYYVYGLSCSYFTGKLEAYLQAKGIPYQSVEMNTKQFRACGEATGVKQLPCVETPDGTWLTDTTAIIEHFEALESGPSIRPADPAAAFCGLLFEDLFDEWYWRPALYYRWAFKEDAKLMSSQLARTMVRDLPLPHFVRQQMILWRQRIVYLKKDGVTRKTAPLIETLYLDTLRALNEIFATRSYLFGDRPCEADYGLFGPFYRHFFCDPTPGALMRNHAPHVAHWVTRMLKTKPDDLHAAPPIKTIPDDLGFFFEMIAKDYIPYLEANAQSVYRQEDMVAYRTKGVDWKIPAAPYRVECYNRLKRQFAALDQEAAETIAEHLPQSAINLLKSAPTTIETLQEQSGVRGRLWRPAAALD